MSADKWFIARDKKKLGPFTTVQMKHMAQAGQLLPIDMVIKDGTTKWMPASQAQGFFPASGSAPPPFPVPAALADSPAPSPPSPVVVSIPPASVPTPASRKLLGVVPVQIAPPIIGMTAVVLLALLASLFCGSFLVFFFSFLHNAGAMACIVLTVRLQKSVYALIAALLTMTAWGWLCFTAVWTVVSILGLLAGIAVGVWALFALFAPEMRRRFSDPSLPAPLDRLPFPALAGVLGGGSLTLILGFGMVLWLTQGSKTGGGSSGNDGGKGNVKNGKDAGIVKVDLPDFSKVDYSFDFSKVDYTKGPQGQKLETWVGDGGLTNAQQYQGPEGKPLFHGKVVKTLGGFKVSESLFFAGYQHGQQTEWYTNGQMKVTGIMKEGKRHGKWQHWHKNGKQQKEAYYLDGKQHGPETKWFEDGQKRLVSSFVDGSIHGLSTEWFINGQKWSEVHFKQGIAHGPATWWNENGKVSMRLAFRDGKTSYDPTSSTVADFDLALKCMRSIPWDSQNAKLQDVFDRFGKPLSGYSEVANLQTSVDQKWIYRCTDGEAVVRCFLSRNDFNGIGTIANMQTIKKR